MARVAPARHVPLSRAFRSLSTYLEDNPVYSTKGDVEGAALNAEKDGSELKLTITRLKKKHILTFRWSEDSLDPTPVVVSMDIPPYTYTVATVKEGSDLLLVLLKARPEGVVDRFILPPMDE